MNEYSGIALDAAIFLGSATFEDKILQHFAENSKISLQEQFKMAEEYKTNKLMVQVCASIKDAYELDEVVPKDLDSFCNATKNLVMQRSFELLGIRKSPSPSLPEERDQLFEHMMNQIIDQVEVQNHHGEVLKDQIQLLCDHMTTEVHIRTSDRIVGKIIHEDPLIKELLEQLRNAHEQGERNFIQAQIQILTFKHIYTRMKNEELGMNPDQLSPKLRSISKYLRNYSMILNRDERSQSRSQKVMLGNREIDEIYRRITREVLQQNQVERPRNMKTNARWLENIRKKCDRMAKFQGDLHFDQRPRPDNLRVVSNQAAFRQIDEFVNSVRTFHYMDDSEFELEHNEAGDINREIEAQNPREQDQEGN
ncbi:hypothetical protein CAEBREN_02072 [Caenorhabditis brenneri]|uniref:Uncharacterized protein n=1 Tax=Caenorhabditis brenneri TaxID=135651 RepID=G0MV21_CAEBE|nr:hypothetical protein CAEBREN_02072 [Caenorhabditis brenneri]